MVLTGTRGSLPCFEDDIAFAVPDVARIASLPRPRVTSSNRVSEPLLDETVTVHQVGGAQGSTGAAARHPGKSPCVLVVWTSDVTAGLGHLRQVYAVWRRLYLAYSRVVTLKSRSPHNASRALYAFSTAQDAKKALSATTAVSIHVIRYCLRRSRLRAEVLRSQRPCRDQSYDPSTLYRAFDMSQHPANECRLQPRDRMLPRD